MNYTTEDLRNIRKLARTTYDKFHLGTATCTWIIVLGIKRQLRQYRGSGAGRKLFGRILSWITGTREQSKHQLDGGVVSTNLLKLQTDTTKCYSCKLAHINARSITNKSGPIQHSLHDQEVDICAITETWVKTNDQTAPKEILPPGYNIITKPRPDGRCGGGLAIVYKSLISVTETECDIVQGTVLEALKIKVKQQNGRSLNLYVIYWYPNTSMLEFVGILSDTLEQNILVDWGDLVLIGDFNVHMDNPTDSDTILFNDFLDSFNLVNKIDFENASKSSHPRSHHHQLQLWFHH